MFDLKFLLISRTLFRGRQKWTCWFDLSCQHVDWNLLSKSAFAEWGFPIMRFNCNKSKLHSPSKSRMSDKLLTEIICQMDGEQILSVTLNQINNTWIHSRKQLGSCWALTIVQFNHNTQIQDVYASKSRMVGRIVIFIKFKIFYYHSN